MAGAGQDKDEGDENRIGDITVEGEVGELGVAGRDHITNVTNHYMGTEKEDLRELIQDVVKRQLSN